MQGLDNMKISKKFHSLPEYILNANLESPSSQNKNSDEDIKISGWFLTKKNIAASDVKIIIKNLNDNSRYESSADINRQDVIDAILDDKHSEKSTPGFYKSISWSNHVKIFFTKNGIEHLWFEIVFIDESDYNNLIDKWVKLNSIEYNPVNIEQLTDIQKKWQINTLNLSYDVNSVINTLSLSGNEKDSFLSFIDRVNRWDFIIELCHYKKTNYIRSCFDNSKSHIIGSITVGNLNVLKLIDSSRVYYIFQNISSCDAIFIPDLNTLFCLCNIEYYQYVMFIDNIHDFKKQSSAPSFGGYLMYFDRPYHYMYDMMLGYFYANTHGCFSEDDLFIGKVGGDFINLEEYFGINVIHKKEKDKIDNEYFIRLGIHFGNGAKNNKKTTYIELMDRDILNRIKYKNTSDNKNTYTLWVGITSQKRSWIEQAEAISYIINNLDVGDKNLRVIFDGWTSPINKSDLDRKETLSDQALMDDILSKVTRHVDIINAIGLTIMEKISIAKDIDYFLVNYSTGSLNVARICKKKGLAHISNSFMVHASEQHIHPNTISIDSAFVNEFPSIYGVAHYSYSIKKEIVFSLLQKNIEIT